VAELLRLAGRLEEARSMLTEAVQTRRDMLGERASSTLTAINSLGALLSEMGEQAEAVELLSDACAARRATQGDTHPETLTAINNLAAHLPQETYSETRAAEELYREALAGRRAVLGDHHPDTLTSMNNLGMQLLSTSQLKDAGRLIIEAFDGACLVFGTKHERTKEFRQNLATVRSVRMQARRWYAQHSV